MVVLDPMGFPIKSLDYLFNQKVSPQVLLSGVKADQFEMEKAKIENGPQPTPCFGNIKLPDTIAQMLFQI